MNSPLGSKFIFALFLLSGQIAENQESKYFQPHIGGVIIVLSNNFKEEVTCVTSAWDHGGAGAKTLQLSFPMT